MIESATALTTRPLRRSAWATPPDTLRPPLRSGFARSRVHVWSAGARPKITLVTAEIASANRSTGRLSAISDSSGIVFGGTSVRIARSAP